MIEQNIGNIERLIRLALGLMLGAWMISRPDINGMELFVVVIAVALILNGVFSRCYLWYVLDINTASSGDSTSNCTAV